MSAYNAERKIRLPATTVQRQEGRGLDIFRSWAFLLLMISGLSAQAKDQTSFIAAVGAAGTDSYAFGIELWAVSHLELLPTHDLSIETLVVRDDADRLRALAERDSDFALVRGEVPTSLASHLRALMVLWPNGVERKGDEATQLLAHADVPGEIVYRVTKMLFEQAAKFQSAHATMGIGSPDDAIAGVAVPFHPGAHRYYEEVGLGASGDATLTADGFEVVPESDDRGLSGYVLDEVNKLAAACRDADVHAALDLGQRDGAFDACDVDAFTGMGAEFMDPSLGEGGLKVTIPGSDGLDFWADIQPKERKLRTPRLEPTM